MKRRWLFVTVVLVAVSCVAMTICAITANDELSERMSNNLVRIEKGMSIEEVKAIIGELHCDGMHGTNHNTWSEFWAIAPDGNKVSLKFHSRMGSKDSLYWVSWREFEETTIERICRWMHLR